MKEDKSYYYGSTKPTISLETNEISKKEKISIIEIIIFCISIIAFILVFIKSEIFLLGLILSASSLIISLSTLIVSYFLETKKEHKYYKLAFWISFLAVILGIFFLIVYSGEDKRCEKNIKEALFERDAMIIENIVINDMKENNYQQKCYNLTEIEKISKVDFAFSPYDNYYTNDSYAVADNNGEKITLNICLIDEKNKGVHLTENSNIKDLNGEIIIENTKKCTMPKECK